MYYHGSWASITMIVKICDPESRRDSWFENRLLFPGFQAMEEDIAIVYSCNLYGLHKCKDGIQLYGMGICNLIRH